AAETDDRLAVIVFDSADPEFFLAHWDIAADPASIGALPPGLTEIHPWLDVLVRLSRLPQVTIAALRGRARGAGSEFALATHICSASRGRAIRGQFELGAGGSGGGMPAPHGGSRLRRAIRRCRGSAPCHATPACARGWPRRARAVRPRRRNPGRKPA